MNKLTRSDLWSLEEYSTRRAEFRQQVIAHKKNRHVALSDHVRLYFEDRLTIQYQIQEMLRIERIFEVADIQAELDAYNPLVPDGSNLKATFMIEYEDENERKQALSKLIGIEHKAWAQVKGHEKTWAIADEDMDRTRGEEKTSSVHFLRFEFTPAMVTAVKQGAALSFGTDHPQANLFTQAPETVRASLIRDFA